MNKTILFDLDGVLVDACDWHYEALNRALRQLVDYEITREEHLSTYNGLPTKVKLRMLQDKGIIQPSDVERISNLKQELTVEVIEDLCTVDQSKIDLMEALKSKGYKLGCVTNSIRKTAHLMLEGVGILHYLDVVISNEDCKKAKPHPEGYTKAMALVGSSFSDTIIVEDSPKGLEAARKTGCQVKKVKNATEVRKELFSL